LVQVLVAEDVGAISIALEDVLADAGFTVAGPFASCAAAMEWLKTGRPDLAVLDSILNDGVCIDLARALRSRGVPFLFLSANHPGDGMPADLHDVPWLEKPISYDRLLEGLSACQERRGEHTGKSPV